MKFIVGFIKSLFLRLLSFILFSALSIFIVLFVMNQTVLQPEFVVSHINKLDLPAFTNEFLKTAPLTDNVPGTQIPVSDVVTRTVKDLQPWIKEQAAAVVRSGYDYLYGKSQDINVSIPLSPITQSVKDSIVRAAPDWPLPAELAQLPPGQVQAYVKEYAEKYSQDFVSQMGLPTRLEINKSVIRSAVGVEVWARVEQVRLAFSYFGLVFYGLIGLMLLAMLLIFVIERNVKQTARTLGVGLATVGAIDFAVAFVATKFNFFDIEQVSLPQTIEDWLWQLTNAVAAPVISVSIGVLAAGVILIILSILYRPKKAAPKTIQP